jgi:hypothetical protein
MTHWTEAADLIGEREGEAQGFVARYVPGALAFTLSAALGVYLVYLRPLMHAPAASPPPASVAKVEADPFGRLGPVVPAPSLTLPAKHAGNPFGALVVQGFGSSDRFAMVESSVPVPPPAPADLRSAPPEDIAPLPPRRPTLLSRPTLTPEPPTVARAEATPEAAPPEAARPTPSPGVFEKLFGSSGASTPKTPDSTLAYATSPPASENVSSALAARGGLGPSGGGFGGFLRGLNMSGSPATRFGDHVAVYDISARVVYLPDGTRLEAHSGLGVARDDPSKVSERMRGATPPATYALSPREEMFHGVAALRLTPVDSNIYGRAGLLAHTYMLGPDGDSNGCVSFRDYDAFLRAFRSGLITKLVVVTRL